MKANPGYKYDPGEQSETVFQAYVKYNEKELNDAPE